MSMIRVDFHILNYPNFHLKSLIFLFFEMASNTERSHKFREKLKDDDEKLENYRKTDRDMKQLARKRKKESETNTERKQRQHKERERKYRQRE